MPIIKISLTEDEHKELEKIAKDEKMSIQDLIRYRLLSKKKPLIFNPEEATKRALLKYSIDDGPFTLPDIYGEDWSKLEPRMTGIFGKRFFNYIKNIEEIEYSGMSSDSRRATYKIIK